MNRKQKVPKPRRRIWVQHVAVDANKLQMRLEAAQAGPLSPQQDAIARGVAKFIGIARAAALREDPIPRRWWNWWRGTLVEAAYRNLHTARAQMIDLYGEDELRAEIPMALARARSTLRRDDPRLIAAEQLQAEESQHDSVDRLRPRLRRLIGDSYEQLDLEHAQLRSFRNIVLLSAMSLFVLVVVTIVVVSQNPTWMPLCFPNDVTTAAGATQEVGQNCPTSSGPTAHPTGADIVVVAMLGALGGALSAALSIRNLKGTSTPYDVPVALAALKVPLGAFTAILALVAIQGEFIPGLSALDSQGQILAYALVFGFAQQAFSRLLDRQAQTLMEGFPGGTGTEPQPQSPAAPQPSAESAAPVEPEAPAEPEATAEPAAPAEPEPAVEAEPGTPPAIGPDDVVEQPVPADQAPAVTPTADQPGDGVEAISSETPIEAGPVGDQVVEVSADGEWEIADLTPEEQQALMEETAEESGASCQVGDDSGWGDDEEADR